jgi:hypothetical protein
MGRLYLPLVLREYVGMPDLVVTSLIATTDSVQVVITNQGDGPAVEEFWIDFYVNPIPPPVAVNQVWYDGRSTQGIVWAITNELDPSRQPLPLLPGQSFTVTFKDTLVDDYYTGFAFPLTPGVPVYAHVDSVSLISTYGGVLENHEARGGVYNNVFGPVTVTGAVAQAGAPNPAGAPTRAPSHAARLPGRPPR